MPESARTTSSNTLNPSDYWPLYAYPCLTTDIAPTPIRLTPNHRMKLTLSLLVSLTTALATPASAQTYGWRGNWTGLYPDAQPPITWGRQANGPIAGLRCAISKLPDDPLQQADPVEQGLITQWLVLGPLSVTDSVKNFPAAQLPDEPNLSPLEGQKQNDLPWQKFTIERNRWEFGKAELEWVDPGKEMGVDPNRVAYAHTYLYALRAGRVRAVVDHHFGLKVWVNGKKVYNDPQRQEILGFYTAISRHKLAYSSAKSPSFEFDLQQGWNRLTCKLSTSDKPGWKEMRFALRLGEVENASYESKNIRWMTPLPERGNATPLVVGDRIFVLAEPDELLCLDKATGKTLWSAFINYEAATPQAQRDANPLFKDKIDPLVAQLKSETDFDKCLALRRQINDLLLSISKKTYELRLDGHLESHFGIVGFLTPTPCSDGRNVYVWSGTGVAACFDLDGNRQWITRPGGENIVYYASSPALIGGKLIVYMKKLFALDAATGQIAWTQKDVNKNSAGVLPAKLAGVDCVVSQQGEVVRASDGVMLYRNPRKIHNDTGWAAPTIIGDTVYLPWYGVSLVYILDFSKCTGDDWQPKVTTLENIAQNRKPDGSWIEIGRASCRERV